MESLFPALSAERIRNNVVAVLSHYGVRVLDCGLASTPAMFMTTVTIGCTASVQITASHHPYDKNGLRIKMDVYDVNGKILDFFE